MGVVVPLRSGDDMSMADLWQMLDDWRAYMVARNRSPDTIDDYEAAYVRLVRRMRVSPRTLTEPMLERFLAESKLNATSRELYMSAAKSIQRFAFKRDWSAVNPYEWDLPSANVKYPPPDYYQRREYEAILRAAVRRDPPQRFWTILLLLETGGRIGSVAAVEPRDTGTCAGERMTFRVVKNGSPYSVALTPAAAEAVVELLSLMEPGQTTLIGRNKRTIGQWHHESAEEAGLPPGRRHAHLLRHTAATLLYRKTRDPMLVKEFLGHKNLQTVHRYAAVLDEAMADATAEPLFGELRPAETPG